MNSNFKTNFIIFILGLVGKIWTGRTATATLREKRARSLHPNNGIFDVRRSSWSSVRNPRTIYARATRNPSQFSARLGNHRTARKLSDPVRDEPGDEFANPRHAGLQWLQVRGDKPGGSTVPNPRETWLLLGINLLQHVAGVFLDPLVEAASSTGAQFVHSLRKQDPAEFYTLRRGYPAVAHVVVVLSSGLNSNREMETRIFMYKDTAVQFCNKSFSKRFKNCEQVDCYGSYYYSFRFGSTF